MLTKSQIQRAAQKSGMDVRLQERDYLQHLLLWLLYSHDQSLALGGGAALRLVYGGNRYADALQFCSSGAAPAMSDLQSLWQQAVGGLQDFGVVAGLADSRLAESGYRFDVSCEGPLHDGRAAGGSRIRIGVTWEPDAVAVGRRLVTSEYDDVRPFVVTVVTPQELMAEKVRSVMARGRPRDLYDLWLMVGLGVEPDHRLIERRLASETMDWRLRDLVGALDTVETGWERDVRHLLPQYVPYEVVKDGIVRWLVGV